MAIRYPERYKSAKPFLSLAPARALRREPIMLRLTVILTPKAEDYSEGECCKNEFTHFYNRAKE